MGSVQEMVIMVLNVESYANNNEVKKKFVLINISECFGKSCQLGEICQSGLCIKVERRLCNLAIRDCGEEFECIEGICHDLLVAEANTTLS